jgi:hypothetical protein
MGRGMNQTFEADEPAVKALKALADALLPGNGGRWPSASTAIAPIARVLEEIGKEDAPWLLALSAQVAATPAANRTAHLQSSEAAEPARFERTLGALYRAYYTSATTLAAVEALAEAGPREASPHFDPDLVKQVLATQAGQRRL